MRAGARRALAKRSRLEHAGRMAGPPITSQIGATENALRALLVAVLDGSGVEGYEAWVYLNVRAAYPDDQVEQRVAEVLHGSAEVVTVVRDELIEGGTLTADATLSDLGATRLEEARRRVAGAVARVTDGIDPAELAVVEFVLARIRAQAEAELGA